MRTGIDASPLLRPNTGIGVATEMIARSLLDAGSEVVGLISGYRRLRDGRPDLDIPLRSNWVPRHLDRVFFDLLRWPSVEAFLGKLDCFIATNFMLPPTRRALAVAFVHDIGRITHPHLYSPRQVARARALARRWSQNADLILTPTEAVAREVVARGLSTTDRIGIVPLAARPLPITTKAPEAVPGDAPFLFCVATGEKRKNLPRLLRAFAQASSRLPHHLVVAGGEGLGTDWAEGSELLARARARIHFAGTVGSPENLGALYRGADLTVCPSLYEGFGLPLLEAMSCGCPVLASDIPPHREVGGDAARFVAPENEEALAQGIVELLRDDLARVEMRDRGLRRASAFSREATDRRLRETLASIR